MSDDIEDLSDEQLADKFLGKMGEEGMDSLSVAHFAESKGGLGTAIQNALNKLGVTPERIERVFGVDSEGCGCSERKRFLDSILPHFKSYKEHINEEEE